MLYQNPENQTKFIQLYEKVEEWAIARNFHTDATFDSQTCKLWEEYGEVMTAFNKKNPDKLKDELGDMVVVLIVMNTIASYSKDDTYSAQDHYTFTNDWILEGDAQYHMLSIPEIFLENNPAYDGYYDYNWSIEVMDKVCDAVGLNLVDCLETAYNKIKDRKGKMVEGKYIKEEDLAKVQING